MTITFTTAERPRLVAVTFDLYRDIHKAIRSELFDVTVAAGRVDVADELDLASFVGHLGQVATLLEEHAEHEDVHIQPALVQHGPALAEQIERDHLAFEHRMGQVAAIAAEVSTRPVAERRAMVHELYVELALFVSGYLAHQDLEERLVMPVLEDALGVDAVIGIHGAIVGSFPPDELLRSLALLLPAMNVDDRAELLGGLRAGAPTELFDAVWRLIVSLLPPVEVEKLVLRLDRKA